MNEIAIGCPELAAIVLAGGEGERLRPLTATIFGTELPKQFCPLAGNETLLEQTLNRVELKIPRWRTVTVLTRAHQRFYEPLIGEAPQHGFAIQPHGRGTAPAVLYGILKIAAIDPRATIAVFPSDHHYSDDLLMMRHVTIAAQAVRQWPSTLFLLGVSTDRLETGYGWIEPGVLLGHMASVPLYNVRAFSEKPSLERAQQLLRSGALWNMFVFVGQAVALLRLFERTRPEIYGAFLQTFRFLNTSAESSAIRSLYDSLETLDFSRDILTNSYRNLAALPVSGLEWSDLGEPHRVHFLRQKLGLNPDERRRAVTAALPRNRSLALPTGYTESTKQLPLNQDDPSDSA